MLLTPRTKSQLEVCEGIHGTWYYHLRKAGENPALCGEKNVMMTLIPVGAWGHVSSHIGERYCKKCEEAARKMDS